MESHLRARQQKHRPSALRPLPLAGKADNIMGQRVYKCQRKSCCYHMPEYSEHGCNYAGITGHTRLAQLPEDKQDPAVCPLYKRGRRKKSLPMPAR